MDKNDCYKKCNRGVTKIFACYNKCNNPVTNILPVTATVTPLLQIFVTTYYKIWNLLLKFIKYVTTTLLHSNIKSNAQFHNIFLVNAQKITIFISESQHHIPY